MHSGRMVARIVFDKKVDNWLQLLVEAFAELDGVPEVGCPRQPQGGGRPRRLRHVRRDSQPQLPQLARHYRFKVDPTPTPAAQGKGKFESASATSSAMA